MSTKLIGTGPNQVPTNADLGSMAYQDSNYVNIGGGVASLSSLTVTDYTKFEVGATAKPTVPASLTMDFAKTQSLDNRIEFSRASIATRTNAKGFIETVSVDTPRFDYDPVTLQCKGLFIEESRANLLTYSDQFDNAAWVKASATITSNTAVSPSGDLTADFLVENTATTVDHYVYQAFSVVSDNSYTFSIFAKSTNRNIILLLSSNAFSPGHQFLFDLTNGTTTSVGGSATGGIQNIGNGWYRCSVTATATATAATNFVLYTVNGTTRAYTGDGTSGVYIWGAQLEAGGYTTSYIPTTTATVTRQADVAKITGTNFSSFYNQTEGSFYVEATRPNYSATTNGSYSQSILTTSDNTDSNRILLFSGASSALYIKESGNVVVNTSTTETWNNLTQQKLSAAYKLNDCVIATGTSTYADTSATIPTVNQLVIGSHFAASAGFFNGCIGKIAYYPKRLTNNELLALVRV